MNKSTLTPFMPVRSRAFRGFLLLFICLVGASCGVDPWITNSRRGNAAFRDKDYTAAEDAFLTALKQAEAEGFRYPKLTISLGNLANVYIQRGRFAEAEVLLRRAIKIWEEDGGNASAKDIMFFPMGKYRILSVEELWNARNHGSALYEWLADTLLYQRLVGEAQQALQESIRLKEAVPNADRGQMITLLNKAGRLLKLEGKDKEAERYFQRAEELERSTR